MKIASKRHLERSGAPFGKGLVRELGGVWSLWGPLESFFDVVFSCLYLGWSSKVVLEASGFDLVSILTGLERILGGFGEGFGRDVRGFWLILGYSGLL